MTLKDWKKDGITKHFWFIKKTERITISDSGAIKPQSWEVLFELKNGSSFSKHFKSKPQALKYAKAYMRKH